MSEAAIRRGLEELASVARATAEHAKAVAEIAALYVAPR